MPLANMTDRVTVLITAESIIAGFMIAYGALNGQLLVDWSRHHGSLLTTYIAGIVIYTIVLTCFVSIVLLFNSIPTNGENLLGRYNAGYDLFLMAILGSAVFVVANGFSIRQFTVGSNHMPISCIPVSPLADIWFYAFLVYAAFLLVLLMAVLIFSRRKLLGYLERNPHLLLKALFSAAVFLLLRPLFCTYLGAVWLHCSGLHEVDSEDSCSNSV
jgi:hypothetical protein